MPGLQPTLRAPGSCGQGERVWEAQPLLRYRPEEAE